MPVSGRKLTIEEALALCFSVGFEGEKKQRWAVAVMTAESGRYVEAWGVNENKSADRGLFQVNTIHTSLGMAKSFTATANAKFAAMLSDYGEDFTPWNAFKSGAYEQFLPEIHRVWKQGEWRALVPTIQEELG